MVVEVNVFGRRGKVSATLNNDLPKCTNPTTTTPPPTTPANGTVPKICRKQFSLQLFFDKIKIYSKPIPELGKYSLDWAAVARPKGAGVCLDKVIAYFNGPTQKCCDGWQMSKPKYPRRYNDGTPIILDLCGNGSRRLSVYFEYHGRG